MQYLISAAYLHFAVSWDGACVETGSVSSVSTEVLVLLDQINVSPCLGMSHFYSRMLWIISFFFPGGPGMQSVVAVGALLSA